MKKITLLALALIAIAAFTACSQGENGSSSSSESSSSQVASSSRSSRISEMPEETPEIVDKSFTFKNDKGQDIPAYALYTKESITSLSQARHIGLNIVISFLERYVTGENVPILPSFQRFI